MKTARFAARLYTYNEAIFMAQTCAMKSAFLTTLSNYQVGQGLKVTGVSCPVLKNNLVFPQAVNNFGKAPARIDDVDNAESVSKKDGTMMSLNKEKKKSAPAEDKDKDKKGRKSERDPKKLSTVDKALPVKSKNLSLVGTSGDAGAKQSLTTQSSSPFIICQINLKRAMIPDIKETHPTRKE